MCSDSSSNIETESSDRGRHKEVKMEKNKMATRDRTNSRKNENDREVVEHLMDKMPWKSLDNSQGTMSHFIFEYGS